MAGPLGISSSRSAALLASVDDFSLDFLDDDGSSSEVALTDGSFSGDGFGGESGFGRSESTDYFFSGGFDDGDSDDIGTDAGTKGCAERLLLKSMPALPAGSEAAMACNGLSFLKRNEKYCNRKIVGGECSWVVS